MTDTTNIGEFYTFNHPDVVRIVNHKIYNRSISEDIVQNFYVSLIDKTALERYDPSRGPYDSYVMMLIDHTIVDSIEPKTCTITLTDDVPDHQDDIWERIDDFKQWIKKNCGKKAASILEELSHRIKGDRLNDGMRKLYKHFLREFKRA